jgi:pantothenate kinase, type III
VLLAIDARNRSIYLGFRSDGAWLARKRIASFPPRSGDEYALLLRSFASDLAADESALRVDSSMLRIDEAWMSSVAPSLTHALQEAVRSAFGIDCRLVGPGVRTGIKLRTDIPSEVGADLVCAAVAAADIAKKAAVVVHFDAAIAFSALGRTGDFLGAAIAPGFYTGLESLRSTAALLPEVALSQDFGERGPAIGRNTAQSLRAGLCLGYSGLVERLVAAQADELVTLGEAESAEDVVVLGSGGEEGRLLFAELGLGSFVPDLVLEGLAIIATRARTK